MELVSPKAGTKYPADPFPMKNGAYYVVLLAGGPRDRARELRDALTTRNIYVKYHWEYKRPKTWDREVPKDVDFVVALTSMMGHSDGIKLRQKCKERGIRTYLTSHKTSGLFQGLYRYGISKVKEPAFNASLMVLEDDADPVEAEPTSCGVEEVPPPTVALSPSHSLGSFAVRLLESIASPDRLPGLPPPRPGDPSPILALVASTLLSLCRAEGVSVMITPEELTINPTKGAVHGGGRSKETQ